MGLQIGRYKIGLLPLLMMILFIILTAGAVYAVYEVPSKPENSISFIGAWISYETMALLDTLVYGIITHLIFVIVNRKRK